MNCVYRRRNTFFMSLVMSQAGFELEQSLVNTLIILIFAQGIEEKHSKLPSAIQERKNVSQLRRYHPPPIRSMSRFVWQCVCARAQVCVCVRACVLIICAKESVDRYNAFVLRHAKIQECVSVSSTKVSVSATRLFCVLKGLSFWANYLILGRR